LHRDAYEPVELLGRRLGQQAFGPCLIVGRRVAVEQAPEERDERDPLQVAPFLRTQRVLLVAHHRFEAVRVEQRFRRERGDDLAEADVGLGERLRVAVGSQEDRADGGRLPTNRQHDDRADVARVELFPDRLEVGIGGRVGDEHGVAGVERALQLGIAIQVDDEVADRRIFVARDQSNLVLFTRQEDRRAVEAERVAEFAGDGLQDVDEMQRGRDFLEDVDDRDEVIALALQLGYAPVQPDELVISPIGPLRRRLARRGSLGVQGERRILAALVHLPPWCAR